jgi:hypothetical protein
MELKFGRILNDELSLLKISAIAYSIAVIFCLLGIFVMTELADIESESKTRRL